MRNPELQRNLWLELTRPRMIGASVVIVFLFLAFSGNQDVGSVVGGSLMTVILILVVFFWGSWMAAGSVVGEIRDRTWDAQRLSAIGPWTMVFGKLFGATSFAWFIGALVIAILLINPAVASDPLRYFSLILTYIFTGIFAHATALLVSLLSIRKSLEGQGRLNTAFFAVAGIAAAMTVLGLSTDAIDGDGLFTAAFYGVPMPSQIFILGSLIIFAGWTILANNRLMRLELQMQNGPWVFLAFVLFVGLYAGGAAFVGAAPGEPVPSDLRLLAASIALGGLAYASMFFDVKDASVLRRLDGALRSGSPLAILNAMPGWLYAYFAAVGALLAWTQVFTPGDLAQELASWVDLPVSILAYGAGAALLFLTRDLLIFLYFNMTGERRRGDFAAVVTILLLYTAGSVLLGAGGGARLLYWAIPAPADPVWMMLVAPGVQCLVMGV
ncbi:MAG: hypothetical protein AAGF19_06810, partial [Pseudomonadota bacterium]